VDLPWGFQFSPIIQYGSARPYNPSSTSNTLNTGGGTALGVVVPKDNPTDYLRFSNIVASAGGIPNNKPGGAQECFYITQQCTIAKYNALRGDDFFQLDARLTKTVKFGEKARVDIIAQAFDLTNRANYGNNYGNDITNPNGFAKPGGFINPTATNTPRSLTGEFGFRFSF
jgi:hypothetical protein